MRSQQKLSKEEGDLSNVGVDVKLKTWEKIHTKQSYEWNGVLTYQAPLKRN